MKSMESTQINNERYAYRIYRCDDTRPQLLMLHGFMGDHRSFDHLIDGLNEFCAPVVVDLLGHGASSKPSASSRYHEDRQVDDLLQLIDKLELAPLYLYGYSMGGRLALKIAQPEPNFLAGLILESTNPGIENESDQLKRKRIDDQRAQYIVDNFCSFLTEWEQLELFKSPLPEDGQLTKKYHRIQSEQSPHAVAASLRGFGTGTMTPCWGNLTLLNLPVLLLAGSSDDKYQKINLRLVQQLPNAKFLSLKAGHRVHLDNPAKFLEKIKQHINKISPKGSLRGW